MKILKPRHPKNLLLVLIAIWLIAACRNDQKPDRYWQLSDASHLQQLFEELAPAPQYFYISTNENSRIIAAGGTVIDIPQGAFKTTSGLVVNGTITVELIELLKAGDMILAEKPTTSGGRLLSSGGQLFFQPTQNGRSLILNEGKSLQFRLPSGTLSSQMALFAGSGEGEDFDWQPVNNPVVIDSASTRGNDSINNPLNDTLNYYRFTLDSLFSWINCDYFYNDPRPLTTFEVCVPEAFDGTNTKVFVYIPSVNSVVNTQYSASAKIFTVGAGYRLPVGLPVVFVAVSYRNGKVYYSIQAATIQQNHKEILQMTEVSRQQLTHYLQNL